MIAIRSNEDEIEIAGSQGELEKIEQEIRGMIQDPALKQIDIPAATNIEVKPFKTALNGLRIEKKDGPILTKVTERTLVVSSSPKNLSVLASYFSFIPDAKVNAHHHFDYFEGDAYIHPDSRSMVVIIK